MMASVTIHLDCVEKVPVKRKGDCQEHHKGLQQHEGE